MTFDPVCLLLFFPCWLAAGRTYEGEFLDITEIKRHQAEEFECITNNGVAPPNTQRVKVTVNCESDDTHTHVVISSLMRAFY